MYYTNIFKSEHLFDENESLVNSILDGSDTVAFADPRFENDELVNDIAKYCSPLIKWAIMQIGGDGTTNNRVLGSKRINKGLKEVDEIIRMINKMCDRQIYEASKLDDVEREELLDLYDRRKYGSTRHWWSAFEEDKKEDQ